MVALARASASKNETANQLPGLFVQCPVSLLERGDLTHSELKLWLLLRVHCIHKSACYPSVNHLRKLMGQTDKWTRQLLISLEEKGLIQRHRRQGQTSIYEVPPLIEPRNCTTAVTKNPGTVLPDSPVADYRTPRNCTTDKTYTSNQMIESDRQPKVASNRNPPKDSKASQIAKIDPAGYQDKFPDLDVPEEFLKWQDWMSAKGKTFKNYEAAFRNWLRNARGFSRESNPAYSPTPPTEDPYAAYRDDNLWGKQ